MTRHRPRVLAFAAVTAAIALSGPAFPSPDQAPPSPATKASPPPAAWRSPDQVAAALRALAAKSPREAAVVSLGSSAGGRELPALRIAAPGPVDPDKRPGVFVSANLEGIAPAGTEAALRVAEKLLAKLASRDAAVSGLLSRKTVWVGPLLNPDAAARTFASPRFDRASNARPLDEDADGKVDEDGPDDLDGNGLITQMRVKDPEGAWIADPKEPRLLRKADPRKGERGVYAVYEEGIDNDGDGKINEDGPGGAEPARNFMHDFDYAAKASGPWPASEPETIAVVRFLADHPAIGLVLDFSTRNTLLNMQQTGQAKAGGDRVKVPKMYAGFFGLDPDVEYTLKEIVDALNALGLGGGMTIDEGMVASFLGLGPAVALDRADVPLFEAVAKDYKDALKAAGLEGLEKRAQGVGKGAFAAYAYYQLGVPVFSTDVWAVPEPKKEEPKDALTAEKLKTMSSQDFLALGEEKIAAFLKDSGAPPSFSASALMAMVKSGQVTPPKMAEMMEKMPKKPVAGGEDHPDAYLLAWSDAKLQGQGFVAWKPFKHPTLGEVEIGGFVPGIAAMPPRGEVEKAVETHADFYIGLMSRLPELAVKAVTAERLDGGLYKVTAHVTNTGWFPTATAQGRRAQTAWPVRAKLALPSGASLFAGRPVETIPSLDGGETRKIEWTVRGPKGARVGIGLWAPRLGALETAVTLD